MASKSLVDLWFYVNPDTQVVDKVLCSHLLGVNIRENKDWSAILPADSDSTTDPANYQIYAYDFDNADDSSNIDDSFDFNDYDAITPAPLKSYDNGSLTLDDLKNYANLIYDGTQGQPTDSEEN